MTSAVLPVSSSELEKALVDVGTDIIDELAPDYGVYFDPATCPETALPFLAHTLGLPIWREDWSIEKKRWVLAEWPIIAGKLGTEEAIRWAVNVADAETVKITAPPQILFAGGLPEDDEEAWEAWLVSLPEIRLRSVREAGTENGVCGDSDLPDEYVTPGMFLGAEDGAATFFVLGPLITEDAVIIRHGNTSPVSFSRRPDTRVGRKGEVVDFFWPVPAGVGLFCDDAGSVDLFIDGAPDVQSFAAVKFSYGAGSETSWNLIGKRRFIQDVTPRLGVIQDEDHIGIFADEPWAGQFVDELDTIRGTYQSFRIIDSAAPGAPVLSFFDDGRLGMAAYTAEIMTKITGKAGPIEAFDNAFFADFSCAGADTNNEPVEQVCEAIEATKSHRDQLFIDLDIPRLRLKDVYSWSDLKTLR